MKKIINFSLCAFLAISTPFAVQANYPGPGTGTKKNAPTDLTVTFSPTDVKFLFATTGEQQKEDLLGGTVKIDGKDYNVYLPAKGPYSLTNTSEVKLDVLIFSNAARISVDYDRDGKVTAGESWAANHPIRFGDKMYSVKSIAKDGKSMVLSPSTAPVTGFVKGLQAPPFEFKDQNGKIHTNKTYTGKYLIIDLWSTTCAPCQMNMPHTLELQKQYGTDKLDVVLLSMDMAYGFPEVEKRNTDALKKLGMPWANVLVPGGWNQVVNELNTHGYGLWMIDPNGKVVVAGPGHDMEEIQAALNFKMKESEEMKAKTAEMYGGSKSKGE